MLATLSEWTNSLMTLALFAACLMAGISLAV